MPEPASERRLAMMEKGATGSGSRDADEAERAVEPQEVEVRVDVVCGGDAVQDEVEAAGVLAHGFGVFGDDDLIRAEAFGVVDLALGGGELHGVRAEAVRELQRHVAESAEADDADLLARADVPVAQRRVGGDAGAEQRRGAGGVEPSGRSWTKCSAVTMLLA